MKKSSLLSRFKIKYQLLFVYIFLIFIPISLISFYLVNKSKEDLLEQYMEQLDLTKNYVNVLLLDITKTNHEIINDLYKDAELSKLLKSNLTYNELSSLILDFDVYEKYNNNTSISSIAFYTYNKQLDGVGNFQYIDSEIEKTDWFFKAKNQMSAFYIITPAIDKISPGPELTFVQKIPIPQTNNFAIVQIRTNTNFLKSRLKDYTQDIYLKLNKDYFYKETPRDMTFLNALISKEEFFGIKEVQTQEVLYTNYNVKPYLCEDVINVTIIDTLGLEQTQKVATNTYTVLILIFILTFILILIFIEAFNRRVNILKCEVENAISGDYSPPTHLEGDDELSQVFNDLKTIFINVKEAEEDALQSKINEQKLINEQQKIEFKMLQSQINPHFLYNTLETIRMNALSSGNLEIATSIKLLGKSMRYVLENTIYSTTTLEKELTYVKTYVDIQNIRFDNNITFDLNCSPEIQPKDVQILPLLLQPIIENSILHGFVDTDYRGRIMLKIELTDNYLNFTISDNGIGMSDSSIEALNLSMLYEETIGKSIGIKNINKRLKIYYNSEGLKFSTVNNLFTVSFKIPMQRSNDIEIINLR